MDKHASKAADLRGINMQDWNKYVCAKAAPAQIATSTCMNIPIPPTDGTIVEEFLLQIYTMKRIC